jgi:hypothetical protein
VRQNETLLDSSEAKSLIRSAGGAEFEPIRCPAHASLLMDAVNSWETERRDDNRKKYWDFRAKCQVLHVAERKCFQRSPGIFEIRPDFSERESHRRVRLRSVDEEEHLLLEHYAYISNNERETAIF